MKIQATHDLPCSADTFWELYFDDGYKTALDQHLALAEHRILAEEQQEDRLIISAHIVPERDIPAPIRKILRGATLSYDERRIYDARRSQIDWRASNGLVGDRMRCEGSLVVQPTGPDSCRRVLDGFIEIHLPVVGRLMERGIAADVVGSYDRAAEFLTRWVRERA